MLSPGSLESASHQLLLPAPPCSNMNGGNGSPCAQGAPSATLGLPKLLSSQLRLRIQSCKTQHHQVLLSPQWPAFSRPPGRQEQYRTQECLQAKRVSTPLDSSKLSAQPLLETDLRGSRLRWHPDHGEAQLVWLQEFSWRRDKRSLAQCQPSSFLT